MKHFSEKSVAQSFRHRVRQKGYLVFKCHPLTNKGMPDYLVHTTHGRTFYVEIKATGEKCSEAQLLFHKMLRTHGVKTYVLDVPIKDYYDLYIHGYETYNV